MTAEDIIMQQAVAIREAIALIHREHVLIVRLVEHIVSDIEAGEDETPPEADHPGSAKPKRSGPVQGHSLDTHEPALMFQRDYV